MGAARRPSQTRRAWVHRAPESQVVSLFARVSEAIAEPPAPWWLRALAAGGYVTHRVFFADEQAAITAGYRPCAVCLPQAYREWKSRP